MKRRILLKRKTNREQNKTAPALFSVSWPRNRGFPHPECRIMFPLGLVDLTLEENSDCVRSVKAAGTYRGFTTQEQQGCWFIFIIAFSCNVGYIFHRPRLGAGVPKINKVTASASDFGREIPEQIRRLNTQLFLTPKGGIGWTADARAGSAEISHCMTAANWWPSDLYLDCSVLHTPYLFRFLAVIPLVDL